MSGFRVPVAAAGGPYGRGVTTGGMATGGGIGGGATAGGAAGDGATRGGAPGGGVVGGARAHPITVLSIPRPRHMIRSRAIIGRSPCISPCLSGWEGNNDARPAKHAHAVLPTRSVRGIALATMIQR